MSISMRDLFNRQEMVNELISLRNSLANHYQGLQFGLREMFNVSSMMASGDGYQCGCNKPSQLIGGELAYAVPQWVAAHNHDTRTIEGIITESKISPDDFPLKPWHAYYDWCMKVRVDHQYRYLHSDSNVNAHGDVIECEWDSAFLPSWAWPQDGARVWMVGRWIYDCGHPHPQYGHKTEIHPPKALVWFRTEAVTFAGNGGPTRANNAVVYIGQNGGYWCQSINDQDYAFDLYLPPKPYDEAVPLWHITPMTPVVPVQPVITPYPVDAPRVLRVIIPLKGVIPHPEEYGAIIAGGWSDPRGTESAAIQPVRVRITKIYMDGDYDLGPDEWHVYIGVNGRWNVWKDLSGWSQDLDFAVDLDLHPTDRIQITASGFEADMIHDYMGNTSGYSWDYISNPHLTKEQREAIEDGVFWQLSGSFNDRNDQIGYFSQIHDPNDRSSFTRAAISPSDYRLSYSIEDR